MSAAFPTAEQVQAADVEQCLRWNRFLPAPQDDGDSEILQLVLERLRKLRSEDEGAFVAASKSIWWR